ncbi:SRPBCC family protein [Antribacter gilvus]|uniref:SRPBCC family protein n=1 Tax=Antribacter gilvus TaxID=2304675 RepID=UPI000F7820B4|nr:SRPBCC family protein [Antribacter gilvus]
MRTRTRLLIAIAVLAVAGTTAVTWAAAPPSNPPGYAGPRPEPATAPDGYVTLTEEVEVSVRPDEFLTWVKAPSQDLGDLVEAGDDATRVVRTEHLIGTWDPASDRSGDRRRVEFATGHFLAEEVLADTPSRFRYVTWGFTDLRQRVAVHYAVAEFAYAPTPAGTRITWTYSFMPTADVLRPLVAQTVRGTVDTMMRGTLDAWKAGAEAAYPAP